MPCGRSPGIRATAKVRSLLPGNACLPEAVSSDDLAATIGVALGALLVSHDLRATGLGSQLTTRGGTMATSVRDAMTEDPRSIGASASVVEAARLMRDEHIGSLPITDDEKLVGMITDRDITTRVVAEAADLEDDVGRGRLLSGPHQRRARQGPRRGAPTHGPPPGSAAARCRERQARRHRRPGRHAPSGRTRQKTGELVEAISEPSEGERR